MVLVAALVAQWQRAAGQCRTGASNPGSGTSPGEGNGKPLQHSCLGNPMDRGAWQATVSVQFSLVLSQVQLFATSWTAARQASLSIINCWSLLKLMSIKSMMPPHHLILCCPLLLLTSVFPASGSFPMSQFFASGGQSTGVSASASVLTMNIQD